MSRRRWSYMSEANGLAGTLNIIDDIGPRAVVRIVAAAPGHCMDTGRLIAQALNALEQEGVDAALGEPKASEHLSSERRRGLEEAAKLCEMTPSQIRLMCGELTAGEMRAVRAMLTSRASAIRALISPSSEGGEEKT